MIFIIVGTMHSNSDLFQVSRLLLYWCVAHDWGQSLFHWGGRWYSTYCQGTPAVSPTQASIRASALNKGGSGDPGAWSIVGRSHTKTCCIRYIYLRPQQITICWLWCFWLNSWCVGYQGLGDPLTHTVSINEIPSHQYNTMVEDSAFWMYFSWVFKSLVLTTRISTWRISTSVQNTHNITNKHQSIWAKPTQILYFQFFISS
jgi:hypothetical protein